MAAQVPSAFIAPQLGNFQPFQPNFQLIAGALQSQQQFFDKTMEEFNRTLQSLPGDEASRQQVLSGLQSTRDRVIDLYSNEGVGAGAKALKQAGRDIRRDFTSGTAAQIQANYKTFGEFQKTQAERLSKNEITKAQYARSVTDIANNWETIDPETGQTRNISPYLNPKAQQVDADKFLNEFIKNVESEQGINFGTPVLHNGVLQYIDAKGEYIPKSKIMKSATNAYLNAVKNTGQLVDEYYYMKGEPDAAAGRKEFTENLQSLENRNSEMEKLSGKELVQYFKDNGLVKINSIDEAESTKQMLMAQANDQIADYNKILQGSDDEIANTMVNQYMYKRVRDIVEPYADAKSFYKDKSTAFRMKDPLTEQSFMRQLSYDEWLRNNAMPNLRMVDPALTFKPLSGESMNDIAAYKNDIQPRIDNLRQRAIDIAAGIEEISDPDTMLKIQNGDWTALFNQDEAKLGMTKDQLKGYYRQMKSLTEEVAIADKRIQVANKESGYDLLSKDAPQQEINNLQKEFNKIIANSEFTMEGDILEFLGAGAKSQTWMMTPKKGSPKIDPRDLDMKVQSIVNRLRLADENAFNKVSAHAKNVYGAITKRNAILKNQKTPVSVYSDWNIPGLTKEETIKTRDVVTKVFGKPDSFSHLIMTSDDPELHGKSLQVYTKEHGISMDDVSSNGMSTTLTKQPLPNGKMAFVVPVTIDGESRHIYFTTDQVSTDGIDRIINTSRFAALSNFNRSKGESGSGSYRPTMFSQYNVEYDFGYDDGNGRMFIGDQRKEYGLGEGAAVLGQMLDAEMGGWSPDEIEDFLLNKDSNANNQRSLVTTERGSSYKETIRYN